MSAPISWMSQWIRIRIRQDCICPVTKTSALQRSMSPRGQTAGILPGSYKDHFMVGLRSKDVAVSAAAVRVLCGLLHNQSVDPEVLDAAGADPSPPFSCHSVADTAFLPAMPGPLGAHSGQRADGLMPAGLLPHRRRKNKELLEELTRDASMKGSPGQGSVSASMPEAAALEHRQQSNSHAGSSRAGEQHTSPNKSTERSAGSADALPSSGNCRCCSQLWTAINNHGCQPSAYNSDTHFTHFEGCCH